MLRLWAYRGHPVFAGRAAVPPPARAAVRMAAKLREKCQTCARISSLRLFDHLRRPRRKEIESLQEYANKHRGLLSRRGLQMKSLKVCIVKNRKLLNAC